MFTLVKMAPQPVKNLACVQALLAGSGIMLGQRKSKSLMRSGRRVKQNLMDHTSKYIHNIQRFKDFFSFTAGVSSGLYHFFCGCAE